MKTFLEYLEEGSLTKFNLANLSDDIKNINSLGNSAELKPLTDDDMSRVSAEDVVKDMEMKKKMGFNNTALGEPLDIEGLRKYGLEPIQTEMAKRIPSKRICPKCGGNLEPDQEYVFGQNAHDDSQISHVPLKDYPWFCSKCDLVWFWNDTIGNWVEG